ncbi:ComE operon protein 2 [Fructilactobacillus fructivorans]|uniref:ComE operon protein 2 n=1 Tax=Fructilactobacillus fructivorans TaxID=1614 RepID=A0AAE6P0V1_9LACO|nr:ComE operon protein 2 [Fructilactobacillus fructivorans]KRK58789.1 ComE operon protein 2 [Fructilactobacillus fructivorans]KRN39598.1 ComE operon protein 2 [Fructilactobacillus fructivorans]KRN43317.1 ComE operon protein 2 [Fructilactobacillus fructivorans]QFX92784.1 ComE operon protein 2 [Fructilactobacillus fructivorans]RDV65623.1 ComE operon protein 2 [Fructilactobacillus fructivorans]
MEKKRIPWDQYFMLQAMLVASRSTCNRRSVGAVLVRNKRVIACGYNGSVSGDVHCIDKGCYLVDGHCQRTIHAEMNAILQCAKFGESTDNAELYVTDVPCLQCTKMLLQAGIVKIKYLRNYHNSNYAKKLLDMKHVALEKVDVNKDDINNLPFESFLSVDK